MRSKAVIFILATCLLFVFTSGCNKQVPYSQYDIYTSAVKKFTKSVNQYDAMYQVVPPDVQQRWKANVDPKIEKGYTIIKVWGRSLEGTGTPGENYAAQLDQIIDYILLEVARQKGGT